MSIFHNPSSAPYYYLNVLFGSACVIFILRLLGVFPTRQSRCPLPPGPKGLPIVGSFFDLPKSHDWLEWTKHKYIYGPISSISILGTRKIILNDPRIATDLLEKRSSIYSNRPCPVFFGKIVGWSNALAFLNNGPTFREHRRQLHQTIGTRARWAYPVIEIEARRLLWRLAFRPGHALVRQIRLTAGAVILSISHGYAVDQLCEGEELDPLVQLADDAVRSISTAGIWLVDFLPFLRYLPEWIPGMNFTQKARPYRRLLEDLVERPHRFVKHQMAQGLARPSFTSARLENSSPEGNEEHITKWIAHSLYSAGADTVAAALKSFFLAMLLFPDVQRLAQEEVDRVTGGPNRGRLPGIGDSERLPYIWAVVKEVMRWRVATPMGLVHVTAEDDVYEGYFIPKGSMVSANIWGFTHDPEIYSDPMDFKPERFMAENGRVPEQDPLAYVFGFGRRVCPGKELAEVSLFVEIAMILATFNISKVMDANGNAIEPCTEVTSATISHPLDFECTVTPRSASALELIRTVEDDEPFIRSDREVLQRL